MKNAEETLLQLPILQSILIYECLALFNGKSLLTIRQRRVVGVSPLVCHCLEISERRRRSQYAEHFLLHAHFFP